MTDLLTDPFLLGAYWGSREESLDRCAARLAACLEGLAGVAPSFDGWHQKGQSSRTAKQAEVLRDPASLRTLLAAGRNRRDADKSVISELGFSASLWNGKTPSVAWNVKCGAHPAAGIAISNVFLIDWPESEGTPSFADNRRTALEAMRVVVESWQPEWATWTSRSLRNSQQIKGREPVLGFVTYFDAARKMPRDVGPFAIEQLGSGNALIADPGWDDFMGHISSMRSALCGTGALREVS